MELELSSNLAADFRIVATTREVVEAALDDCGIEKSYEDALKTIGVNSPTAHMLRIVVTDEDPQQVADFSNALSEQMKLKIAEVMGIRIPSTVERATVPTEPLATTDPMVAVMENVKRNCILGGVAFLVLTSGAVLLVHYVGNGFKEKMAVIRGKQRDHKLAA